MTTQIKDKIYNHNLIIFIGSKQKFYIWQKKKLGTIEKHNANGGLSFIVENKKSNCVNSIIWFPEFNKDSFDDWITLNHEIGHISMRVIDNVGIKIIPDDSNEAYFYYHDYLFAKAIRKLAKGRKKKK